MVFLSLSSPPPPHTHTETDRQRGGGGILFNPCLFVCLSVCQNLTCKLDVVPVTSKLLGMQVTFVECMVFHKHILLYINSILYFNITFFFLYFLFFNLFHHFGETEKVCLIKLGHRQLKRNEIYNVRKAPRSSACSILATMFSCHWKCHFLIFNSFVICFGKT